MINQAAPNLSRNAAANSTPAILPRPGRRIGTKGMRLSSANAPPARGAARPVSTPSLDHPHRPIPEIADTKAQNRALAIGIRHPRRIHHPHRQPKSGLNPQPNPK